MLWWIWTHGIAIVVGIVIGALVWRKNAKRFSELEAKGKTVVDVLKK
jgi:uncharacterized membrane-anchored protein YhcB (DUF1043 family)